jgi:outer membrane protein assembly factor BamB
MRKKNMLFRKGLVVGILVLMLLIPSTFAVDVKNGKEIVSINLDDKTLKDSITKVNKNPLSSPWPMYCHDVRHTGRSEYSTANNPLEEKWWFKTTNEDNCYCSYDHCFVNIAGDGTVYLTDVDGWIYALYPNGALKWMVDYIENFDTIECHPAIGSDGTIYIGTYYGHFYAIYPNGTLKWEYVLTPGSGIFTSPTIDSYGTIYFGSCEDNYLNALYPNGTIKWRYKLVSGSTSSSPAIATDGTIYIGDDAGYLYAICPNGTLCWKVRLQNNGYIPNSPSIADDGTIYIATTGVETPSYLYAVNPSNGSVKWKYEIGSDFCINPSLGEDGTIYALCSGKLYAVNPDGSEKWTYTLGTDYILIYSDPAISADGTIYVAAGGISEMAVVAENYLYAFNPDGSIRWCKEFDIPCLGIESSPVIGADGTIYLGLCHYKLHSQQGYSWTLYLHAFNERDTNAPSAPQITGPTEVKPGECYNYTIVSTDPNGDDIYYYVSWGEPTYYEEMIGWFPSELVEIGPFPSGEEITINHTWTFGGPSYTMKVISKDTNNLVSPWSTLGVTMPENNNQQIIKQSSNLLFFQIMQRLLNIR